MCTTWLAVPYSPSMHSLAISVMYPWYTPSRGPTTLIPHVALAAELSEARAAAGVTCWGRGMAGSRSSCPQLGPTQPGSQTHAGPPPALPPWS